MASIEPFIHRKIVVLHQDASTGEAARAMCEHRIGCLMVADHQGHLVGIVTDRDLVCHSRAYPPSVNQRLSEVMTKSLITIDEFAKVDDVVNLMEIYGVRRIPVVRRTQNKRTKSQERCVGIVTLDDLIASRSIDHIRLSRIVQSQMFRRKRAIIGTNEAIKARARSAAREGDTLKHFYRVMADKLAVRVERAEPVVKFILTDLLERVNYTTASNLISQLPRGLQDELIELPGGPDRTITAQRIVLGISRRFGFDETLSKTFLNRFWLGLKELVSPGELEHVLAQLPEDFREIFSSSKIEPRKKSVAA